MFFSEDFKIFRNLAFLCFPSVSVCVHTHKAGRIPALQQHGQSSENLQNIKEKTQYLMNTLYVHKMPETTTLKSGAERNEHEK